MALDSCSPRLQIGSGLWGNEERAMIKLIYVILGFGVVGNIAVYYALYKVRMHNKQLHTNQKRHISD